MSPGQRLPTLLHGLDAVDLKQFEYWLGDPRAALRSRFTETEKRDAKRPKESEHLASCFAAKEALLKALGMGAGAGIAWTDIELGRAPTGAPLLVLRGKAKAVADAAGAHSFVVTVTHTRYLVIASVVGWATPDCGARPLRGVPAFLGQTVRTFFRAFRSKG